MHDLLTAALGHAARGWRVFPLRPDDKRPAFPDHAADDCTGRDPRCRAGHVGWEARATTDPDRIRRAWSARPYGIGLACGPSRLVVVDLDTPKTGGAGGRDGLTVLAELAAAHAATIDPTYTVTTGRGGTHLYYRHPDTGPALRNTAGTLGPMVDTRAHGGYVVAPGSTVAGRPYTVDLDTDLAPLPGWLAALLARPRCRRNARWWSTCPPTAQARTCEPRSTGRRHGSPPRPPGSATGRYTSPPWPSASSPPEARSPRPTRKACWNKPQHPPGSAASRPHAPSDPG